LIASAIARKMQNIHRRTGSVCKAAVTNVRSGRRRELCYTAPPRAASLRTRSSRLAWRAEARRFRWNVGFGAPLLSSLRNPLHFANAPLSVANFPTEAAAGTYKRWQNFKFKFGKPELI
jgi:hypothetical protein